MKSPVSFSLHYSKAHFSYAAFTAALSLSLIINVLAALYQIYTLTPHTKTYTYLGHDHPRELPIAVRTAGMVFHDDLEHYPIHGAQAWAEWNAIRPPGGGYVFLGEAHLPFGVAMWHQLHCLNHLRAIFVNGDDGSEHTAHCFHYLRQALLCAADTTLEEGGRSVLLANGGLSAPGEGVAHVCRDWKQVYDWQAEQYAKWTPEMEERLKEPSRGVHF